MAAFDRIARSTKNFLEIVDELNELGIEFVSAREAIDTSGPMGRMFITLGGLHRGTRTVADYRADQGGNATGTARRAAARTCAAQYRPRCARSGPPGGNVTNQCRQKNTESAVQALCAL